MEEQDVLAKIAKAANDLHLKYRDIPEEELVTFFDLVCSLTCKPKPLQEEQDVNIHQISISSGKQLKIGKIIRWWGLRWRVVSQEPIKHGHYPTVIECLDYREQRNTFQGGR